MSASSSKSKRPLTLFDVGVKRRKAIEDTRASVSEVKEIEYTIHLVSKKSWEDARKTCQSKGGDLLSIADKKEQDLLLSNIKDHMKEYWIGLNDLAQEYKYVWSDGTPFSSTGTYKNWAQNEPKHNGRRCVQLWGKNIMKWDEMKWYGDICSKKKYFICEKHTGWWQLNN